MEYFLRIGIPSTIPPSAEFCLVVLSQLHGITLSRLHGITLSLLQSVTDSRILGIKLFRLHGVSSRASATFRAFPISRLPDPSFLHEPRPDLFRVSLGFLWEPRVNREVGKPESQETRGGLWESRVNREVGKPGNQG